MPAVEDGTQVFVLRDLEELTDKPLALSAGGMLLISFLDGRLTASALAERFRKSTGAELDAATILQLVNALDEALYLETPAVAAKRQAERDRFKASPKRAAAFAGPSYPAEPPALAAKLTAFFTAAAGPGRLPPKAGERPAPRGLVAPHIDFGRGGPAYAHAYQALSERRPPDLVVALGVAHISPESPWVFTPKTYETPLGPQETDAGLYDELASKLWYDPRADEWTHKAEHSLEFQAVWLKHLWGKAAPKWVPILVSSFERWSPKEPPSKAPAVEKALKDLGAVLAERRAKGQNILVLCGVDLAHVGPRFGDEVEMTPELHAKIEAEDRKSLVAALSGDADAFYGSVIADDHWRKVCGLSALYTGLRLMKAMGQSAPGRLLTYGQAPDPAGGVVSFASAVFD